MAQLVRHTLKKEEKDSHYPDEGASHIAFRLIGCRGQDRQPCEEEDKPKEKRESSSCSMPEWSRVNTWGHWVKWSVWWNCACERKRSLPAAREACEKTKAMVEWWACEEKSLPPPERHLQEKKQNPQVTGRVPTKSVCNGVLVVSATLLCLLHLCKCAAGSVSWEWLDGREVCPLRLYTFEPSVTFSLQNHIRTYSHN